MNLNYFHFPHINDDSYLAAHATECAGEQGSFWQYHDTLYEKQGEGGRGVERLEGFAQDLGLDTGRFSACMEARTYDGVIQRDINLALRNEVSVTPTIFVLSTDPNQTGTKYDGSPSFEDISAVIDELLATPVPTPAPTPTPTAIPVPLAPTPTATSASISPTPTSLASDTSTPAPTPSPTPIPTPTPTAVPTPRPTPVPTPTPTPTPSPVPEPVPSGRSWNILGSLAAPVILEEFSDFQWGVCRNWALGPAQEIKRQYIDQGQVKLVLRHRTTFGPASRIMSLGTECAGEQDKFWEFHDARIRSGSGSVQGQISLAQTLGLNVPQFTACMEEQRYQNFLEEDRAAAQANGIFTQPAFIISSGGQSVKRIGSLTAGQLGPIIDELLN